MGIQNMPHSKKSVQLNQKILYNNKYIYWNKNYKCWFGSRKCIDNLINSGTQWYSKKSNFEYPQQSFNNMNLEKYGKGYLLIPKNNDINYGIKYFHGGWWINS